MNAALTRALVRLYPQRWRERYGAEFDAMLQDEPGGLRALTNVVFSAFCERISSTGANQGGQAMNQDSSRFQLWCDRAPWAAFGVAPLFLLTGAYGVAGLILWSGWEIFLPGTITPFVRINGIAVIYFGIGRVLYYGAPLLVGWALAIVAARQRVKLAWPAVGLVVVALLGAAVKVHASRAASGIAHVSMSLGLGNSIQGAYLVHAVMILLVVAVPYLIWRMQGSRTLSL